MKRAEVLQEVRKIRFEEAYEGWMRIHFQIDFYVRQRGTMLYGFQNVGGKCYMVNSENI